MDKQTALIIVGLFADLVLIGQILIAAFVIVWVASRLIKKNKFITSILKFASENALALGFLIALIATTGSLFFSEIAHFTPCKLCWYQRIFMYPQVILLGIASIKNDFGVKKYVLRLSVIGLLIAIYHYVLQMSPIPLPCSDEVANCALKQVSYFGYITIPLMAATAFAMIIVLMLQIKKK